MRVSLLLHVAHFTHQVPEVASKMYNPVADCAKAIDSLLTGPDSHIWIKSFAIEFG